MINIYNKESLIEKAESTLVNLEEQIASLQERIERNRIHAQRMEADFRASEDDFVIAATDQGLDENEIKMQMDDLHATHISDPDLINIKRQIEEDELDLISLKQNRQIYLYYLEHNEGDEQ